MTTDLPPVGVWIKLETLGEYPPETDEEVRARKIKRRRLLLSATPETDPFGYRVRQRQLEKNDRAKVARRQKKTWGDLYNISCDLFD
tara:strand:+ start:602 stop:862 length:261 start_codon:yes stop_codon:yes gene_type:complete